MGGYSLEFPERVYTEKEVKTARELVNKGYKHILTVKEAKNSNKKLTKLLN